MPKVQTTSKRSDDPHDWYTGPLRGSDGRRAYNNYFWPGYDSWYWSREWPGAGRNDSLVLYSLNNLGVVELNNGRWLNTKTGCFTWSEQFESRQAAFEAGARIMRSSVRKWFLSPPKHGGAVSKESYAATMGFIAWVLATEAARGWVTPVDPDGDE